jgi:hypothetical protein
MKQVSLELLFGLKEPFTQVEEMEESMLSIVVTIQSNNVLISNVFLELLMSEMANLLLD